MRLTEGQVLDGRYTLIRRIGSGGMADVWLARDGELGREVALKVLHDNFARDQEFVSRFRREASSAAGLQHPNVVGVFDRGAVEDTYYIAMEYVEGAPLRDLINRGLTIPEAVEVTRQVLAAAGFAHERGLVHRDLKPMNVLIDGSGRVRVTDFGIARAAGGSEITRTGSVLGTAQYLSPEQAQGMEVTATSDVYAVGIILFEMLTGRVPFEGDNAVAIAMKQVSEQPPPPSSINPAVPPALDSVVLRALAKDPAARYQSAAEMTAALDAAEANPQLAGHTERYEAFVAEEDRDRKWWWIGAAVAVLLVLAALWFFFLRGDNGTLVPGVKGDTETAARLKLANAGFAVDVQRQSNGAPEGTVLEQDPQGGTRAGDGSTVTIFVSLGPAPTAVPDVIGKTQALAVKKLKKAGFKPEVQKRASGNVAPGRVIDTDPAPDTQVAAGETVTVVVSSGSKQITVPNVVGQSSAAAESQLRNAGFVVNSESQDSDEPENQVISQDPAGDTTAKKGSEVTITYSTGAGSITLGDYVGQKASYAERKLQKQGLQVKTISQDTDQSSDDGRVLEQAPGGGSRVKSGSRVTLTVGHYVAPTTTTSTTSTTSSTTPSP